MRRGSRALSAVLLTLAVAVTGCGEESDPETDTQTESETLSEAEFLEQADAICAEASADLEAEATELGDAPSDEQILAYSSDVLVPSLQGQHDDIAGLEAPEEIDTDVEAMLDGLQSGIDALEEDPSLILSQDATAFDAANDAAEELGLAECGEN